MNPAPWMAGRTSLGMGFQEMMQHMQQRKHVRPVPAPLRLADVVDDHVSDMLNAIFLLQQILRERCGGNFGDVLVLRDGENLFLGQAA